MGLQRRAEPKDLQRERQALLRAAPRAELAPAPLTLATVATF